MMPACTSANAGTMGEKGCPAILLDQKNERAVLTQVGNQQPGIF
jgi:hypothetical protein